MSSIIKQFYENNKTPGFLIKKKLGMFEKHSDVASEFEYWIKNNDYKTNDAITVEGYTAKSLSEQSKYLAGEGAFVMMIELRENPQKAKEQLLKGFKFK